MAVHKSLSWILTIVALMFRQSVVSAYTSPPNILIFVIDDMPFLQKYNESAPIGVNLADHTVEYDDYPTPNINEFRNEAILFPRSYCGGPKCSPSRYSVLTGRMPSRSEWAATQTVAAGHGADGTDVEVFYTKISGDDTIYNLPRVLQDNGYYTGTVGKWHLMPSDDNGHNIGCSALESGANADLYGECTDIVKEQGFDFVDAFFYGNIELNDAFTHNPEWIASRAQAFIDEAVDVEDKPFFLYAASTLVHGGVGALYDALTTRSYTESPKGILTGDEVPDDTTMPSRDQIWADAEAMAQAQLGEDCTTMITKNYAKYLWMDYSFGAIIDHLRSKEIYRNTVVILQNDHGQEAKGMLYEQGSRIINAVRYGRVWGTEQLVLGDDFLVSNADLAPTIFDLVGATVPNEYTMDGISWLDEVQSAINGDDTEPDDPCCEMRYIDVKQSRSIVTADYQYIWRANDDVETAGSVDDLYAKTHDEQQLYDLNADPDEQVNLITDYESYRDGDSDGALSSTITSFQSMMKDYIDETCPEDTCEVPAYTFCTDIVTGMVRTTDLDEAETLFAGNYPGCNMADYYYWVGTVRSILVMEVCCAENADIGASFPGNYTAPSGYTFYTDTEDDSSPAVLILNGAHVMMISGIMLFMLIIGFAAGRVWDQCRSPKMDGIKMTKLKNESENESDISDDANEEANEQEMVELAQEEYQ